MNCALETRFKTQTLPEQIHLNQRGLNSVSTQGSSETFAALIKITRIKT